MKIADKNFLRFFVTLLTVILFFSSCVTSEYQTETVPEQSASAVETLLAETAVAETTETPSPEITETPPSETPSDIVADIVVIEIPLSEIPTPEVADIDEVFEYNGFVDITEIDPRITLDIRFATPDNWTGAQQYEFPLALMQKETAEKLIKAQDKAYLDGYRIRIYDSYRPLSVQQNLYDANPPELAAFVAKPSKTERHSIGLALDVGLSDLNGVEIKMPSEWDEFNEKAYINYSGGEEAERKNRDYLIDLMTSAGFTVYSKEWWHYNAPMKSGMEAFDFDFREFTEAREKFYAGN